MALASGKQAFSSAILPLRTARQTSFSSFAALKTPLRKRRQASFSNCDALKPALCTPRQTSFSGFAPLDCPLRESRQAGLSSFDVLKPPRRSTGKNQKPAQTACVRRPARSASAIHTRSWRAAARLRSSLPRNQRAASVGATRARTALATAALRTGTS
jgi:hypothetical protein